jgi:3-methylcrotonyl-CoA carboxylase alpha subunit
VEHPVTEMITGQDLVEWQLKVASGFELPIKDQSRIPCIGNSMEARIYAENPAKDFLPVTGNVWHHRGPVPSNLGGDEVRVDTGLEAGRDISVYYDPMVSKLIVHGKNREEARKKLIESLQNYQIAGVPSNIPFLLKCAQHPVFAEAGATNTGFLEDHADDVKLELGIAPMDQAVCALVAALALEDRESTDTADTKRRFSPWSNLSGSFRIGSKLKKLLKPLGDETAGFLQGINCTSNHDGSFEISVYQNEDIEKFTVRGSFENDDKLEIVIDGAVKRLYTAVSKIDLSAGTIDVNIWPKDLLTHESEGAVSMVFEHPLYSLKSRPSSTLLNGEGRQEVTAPMTGKVTRINFGEGDQVDESDVVIVMEAMKMEHAVTANTSGFVSKLNCRVGDVVEDSEVLAILGEDDNEKKIAS